MSLENLEMYERKGIIFPLQFMGNVIPSSGPRGSNSWRSQLLGVNLEECAPGLRRRFAGAHHVFADTALTDVDAEFEEFAMDAGCCGTQKFYPTPI